MEGIQLGDILLAIITLIMTAGVPWAFSVHGRLTAIETSLKHAAELSTELHQIRTEVHAIQIRLARIEDGFSAVERETYKKSKT